LKSSNDRRKLSVRSAATPFFLLLVVLNTDILGPIGDLQTNNTGIELVIYV
jgi:hypothetical protein